MLNFNGVQISWTGHDGFRLVVNLKKVIYIDPFHLTEEQKNKKDADIVLISHSHFDHLSLEDLNHVIRKEAIIIAPHECIEKLKEYDATELISVKPGDKLSIGEIPIEIVSAYNTNKKYHPKTDDNVGFVLTINNQRIYHTGDTDHIPEMRSINPDIALVPVSGTYVMTSDEAAQAVNESIKPKKIAIPMHYGDIVGTKEDAEKFKELVKVCNTEILFRE